MNKSWICGRTTRAIDLQKTQNGVSVVKFTVAVDRRGRDKGTDFIPVTAFGNLAEAVAKFVGKGDRIGVDGRIRIETRDTSDGRRTYFDIIADNVEFLQGPKRPESHYATPEDYRDAPVVPSQLPQQLNQEMDEDWVEPNDLPF